jgi:Ca2+-binding RTX toxin-like protein
MTFPGKRVGLAAATAIAAVAFSAIISGGATAGTSDQDCRGHNPTVGGLTGTNGRDVIVGTNGADAIDGKGGNDIICGGRGNDSILGGTGNDYILANAGRDFVEAGEGDDKAKGNAGSDCPLISPPQRKGSPQTACTFLFPSGKGGSAPGIFGGPGDDIVGGGAGNDVVSGEEDDDINRCASGIDYSPDDEGTNKYRSCELPD